MSTITELERLPEKLTKNCLYPWQFLQVHAGGMMQCCAVGNDADLGDFIIDYCQKVERGEQSNVLNNPGLRALRQGILTGNLRPMCRKCFFVPDKLVTTTFLRQRLLKELDARMPAGTDLSSLDLSRAHAYKEMAISFTNRCNLRCVYCIQSTQAKTNPFFKMEFPEKYAGMVLDFFAAQGIDQIRSCVEGEPTVYRKWCEVFSAFKRKYPHISLYTTTNLCRKYTEAELELLARYKVLDVSCDTIDPDLYHKMRYPGRVETVLRNIELVRQKARDLGIPGPLISLHVVVSSATWRALPDLADWAFAHDCLVFLGNYEERNNAIAYQQGICRPLAAMSQEEQREAREVILKISRQLAERYGRWQDYIQGGLLYNLEKRVEHNHNRFEAFDDNPLLRAFQKAYPHGEEDMHLDIVYDYDNIAYNGVLFSRPARKLRLEGIPCGHLVLREVSCYAPGHCSHKYNQTVLPGYRRTVAVLDGVLEYEPQFPEDVEKILLTVEEWW